MHSCLLGFIRIGGKSGVQKALGVEMNVSHRIVFGSGHRGGHTLVPEILETGWGSFVIADCGHLRPHAHPDAFEFCFILGGEVEWNTGTSVDILREGDVYISQPDEVHWGTDSVMHPCSLYWVIVGSFACGFNWGGMDVQLARELDTRLREIRGHRVRGSPKLRAAFQEIVDEHRLGSGSEYQRLLRQGSARAALLGLLIELVRADEPSAASPSPGVERVELPPEAIVAIQVLHRRAHDPEAVRKVREITGISYKRLNEMFVKSLGTTLPQYWLRQRVRLAREQLLQADKTVTDIATELGFSSSQHFSTVFRRITGLTPTAYRMAAEKRVGLAYSKQQR